MNKKYFLLTCLAAFPFALTAQENNRYEEITNPKLTSINREPGVDACQLGNSITWKPSPTAPRTS